MSKPILTAGDVTDAISKSKLGKAKKMSRAEENKVEKLYWKLLDDFFSGDAWGINSAKEAK